LRSPIGLLAVAGGNRSNAAVAPVSCKLGEFGRDTTRERGPWTKECRRISMCVPSFGPSTNPRLPPMNAGSVATMQRGWRSRMH